MMLWGALVVHAAPLREGGWQAAGERPIRGPGKCTKATHTGIVSSPRYI